MISLSLSNEAGMGTRRSDVTILCCLFSDFFLTLVNILIAQDNLGSQDALRVSSQEETSLGALHVPETQISRLLRHGHILVNSVFSESIALGTTKMTVRFLTSSIWEVSILAKHWKFQKGTEYFSWGFCRENLRGKKWPEDHAHEGMNL